MTLLYFLVFFVEEKENLVLELLPRISCVPCLEKPRSLLGLAMVKEAGVSVAWVGNLCSHCS